MASSVAALLLCAFFFVSTAHPAFYCPTISPLSCKGDVAAGFKDPHRCGDNLFWCRKSTMEIKFRRRGQWYRVVGEKTTSDDNTFQIQDPTLSRFFNNTDCDFLYSFPQPGPAFAPPQTSADALPDRHSPYCSSVSNYGFLFCTLIKRYQQGLCSTYDLYYAPKELQDSQDPTLRNTCLPQPGDDPPIPIWKLSMNNINLDATFSIVSVGFSRRHRLHPSCFNSSSAGQYTCGNKHGRTVRKLIIGFSTATGLTVLASLLLYMWCMDKKMKTLASSTLISQTSSLESPFEIDPEMASNIYPTQVFRYEELHEATNGFSRSNELDHGGQGTLYRGKLQDGRTVAVKRLHENSCKRAEQFMNEIAILSRLRHPNLVALYGCTSRHSRELLLVYEFIPNGTIADHLHGHRAAEGALTWPVRLLIAVETAMALAYLHAVEPPIVHRDVKTKNILLDGDFHVRVADFGLSRLLPVAAGHVSTLPQGTPGYVDPEYHRCYQLTDKSDVYSFGVVLAELISSKPAVDVTRSQHEINLSIMALNKIQNAALQELVDPKLRFETDWEVSKSIELVAELVMMCLQGERDMRPTMEGVLKVLQGIAVGVHEERRGEEADYIARDNKGLQKNCELASPDSVMNKWPSRMTTPNTSG